MRDDPHAVKGGCLIGRGRRSPLDIVRPIAWWEDMNDPEVIMLETRQKPKRELIAHRVALEAAALALGIVGSIPPHLKSLADQIVRSASSVPANLAEGAGRTGRDRKYHWRIAYGSALELRSHVELLMQVDAVDETEARAVLAQFDRVCAMTWRLLHRRG